MRLLLNPQLNPATETGWRRQLFDIIYRHDTPP
ncbi:MAG: ion transporter, partial [Xanthomonadaceae bacterium]|nr:ion transporter [Xanthomonadaceae bacterium]